MIDSLFSNLKWVSALGCGLMAGVFFAFSTFVMKALARLPAEQGIAAMQSINVVAEKSWFLAAFLGTTALCAIVLVGSLVRWGEASAPYLLAGAAVFLAGGLLVTVCFNVPLNRSLAALPATAPDRAARWARFLTNWMIWNHVRTLASLIAAGLLIFGWRGEGQPATPAKTVGRQVSTEQIAP